MTDHLAVLEDLAEKWERERATAHPSDAMLINKKIRELRETIAAIALMRGQSEESEADALRRRLHKLADYWIEITRDQDIAYTDRPLLEMYDKGLTKCATDLRNKLAEGPSR